MSLLRNTDVKKHLARAVPRFVSPDTEKSHQASDDTVILPTQQIVPDAVTTDAAQKVEPV